MEENQKEIARLLGLIQTNDLVNRNNRTPSWAEIYAEIGRLKEKAQNTQKEIIYMPSNDPLPLSNFEIRKDKYGRLQWRANRIDNSSPTQSE
jgi:hypothetical protein